MTISAMKPDEPEVAAGFESILFAPGATPAGLEEVAAPDCLHDLNLDQVIEAITALRPSFDLRPFFLALLDEQEAIEYRHEVLRDLEDDEIRAKVDAFAAGMERMRKALDRADGTRHPRQRQAWFLQAVGLYRETIDALARELAERPGESVGLHSLARHLRDLGETPDFLSLGERQGRIAAQLGAIRYTVQIRGDRVHVDDYDGEIDYGEEIRTTFARFRQGEVKGYRFRYDRDPQMNHVEGQIFDLVARLNPEVFGDLERFAAERADFLDPVITRLDRELQFYLAYLDHIEPLRRAGLDFCEPLVDAATKEIAAAETFDLGLAAKLVGAGATVVTNDWSLSGAERIFVVSGPNQGGKTTFARTFGQLHYLARLGLPVPGREARLFLGDRIFTHFERQEDHSNLSGKLEDDLVRVRGILDAATPRSIVVMNESFSSTALEDARLLGRRVLERLSALDLLCVYVTFVDELASLNEKVVSLTSTVDPDEPATRTFKVVRHPADGKAYAIAIAEKYGLTFDRLRERIR
ncbi:MAG TPA: hypothetical protein VHA76_06905 [Solirubrobacterales bacterium]|nr:hypothetical protein [Solirubrobacterales bacterium]